MRRVVPYVLALFMTLGGWLGAAEPIGRTPVLLELFTSEGCSSCPPADRLLETLDRTQPVSSANIIVLSEHVDYWNSLGWRDPFSSAAFSGRQERYASKLRLESVYTPQLIVDGRSEVLGSDGVRVREAIEKAAKQEKAPLQIDWLESDGKQIRVRVSMKGWTGVAAGTATLFLAIASNEAQSRVSAGENSGKQLTHVAVVRSLQSLGDSKIGSSLSRDLQIPVKPADKPTVRIVAFLQDTQSQQVLGVAELRP